MLRTHINGIFAEFVTLGQHLLHARPEHLLQLAAATQRHTMRRHFLGGAHHGNEGPGGDSIRWRAGAYDRQQVKISIKRQCSAFQACVL